MCQHRTIVKAVTQKALPRNRTLECFTKEEHEPHELAKATDLGVPVLTVGRGSSQYSSPPRTTLDIHIGDV